MATIGELAVNVVAKTEKLRKGLKSGGKEVSKFSKSVGGSLNIMGKFNGLLATIGLTLSAGAIIKNLTATAAAIDKLAKTSEKLGVATDELGALQHAAEMNGIEVNAFNVSLQRMTRRLSEAARGGGVLVPVLDAMNLNAAELVKLNPAQQFARINKELGKVPAADRIRTAFAFFDSDGVNNIRLAGKNLAVYREEARRLGKLVTTGEAAEISKMNDSFARLKQSMQGLSNRLVIDLAPGVMETVEGLRLLLLDNTRQRRKRLGASKTTEGVAQNPIGWLGRNSVGSLVAHGINRQSAFEFGGSAINDPAIASMLKREAERTGGDVKERSAIEKSQLDVLRESLAVLKGTMREPVEIGR